MLASIVWILLAGFFAGQIVRRLGAPPLIGMILVGILLGPQVLDVIGGETLAAADALRTVAVMIILVKAGLGLDRAKLAQQGSVALRLGFLPATCEALVVAVLAMYLFDFDFLTGLLLGVILGAESPAVIVPGMLHLKRLGLGVAKGIPDAILTGSALSDVLILLVFSLLLNFFGAGGIDHVTLTGGLTLTALQLLPFQVLLEISMGLLIGYLAARLIEVLLVKQSWTANSTQDLLVVATLALLLVIVAPVWPYYSGYLAAMALGFFLIERDAPLARTIRDGFDGLWTIAEIVLFVLLGATIELEFLGSVLIPGLVLLALGLVIGRMLGWWLSTLGSNWNWRERFFLLPGNMPKATVQAAIGALPLAAGVPGGETILALAALSILVTAPLGAWFTRLAAPLLLEQGEIDPTKVTLKTHARILVAVDTSAQASRVLTKAAELARQNDAEVVVLHVINHPHPEDVAALELQVEQRLADVRHTFVTVNGTIPEAILHAVERFAATDIVMGKRGHRPWEDVLLGSISQAVIEQSSLPVLLVDGEREA